MREKKGDEERFLPKTRAGRGGRRKSDDTTFTTQDDVETSDDDDNPRPVPLAEMRI